MTVILEGTEPRFTIYPTAALTGTVWRIIDRDPPSPSDFDSYLMSGTSFPDARFFEATGVSMFANRIAAAALARRRIRDGEPLGSALAEVDLRAAKMVCTDPGDSRTSHLTVWGLPSRFAPFVIRCVAVEELAECT